MSPLDTSFWLLHVFIFWQAIRENEYESGIDKEFARVWNRRGM